MDDSSFYSLIEKHGGIVKPDQLPPPFNELAALTLNSCCQIRDGINESKFFLPVGNLQLGLVSNADFNAFAHAKGNTEGVAIYLGVFTQLCRLAIRLWAPESPHGLLSEDRVGLRALPTLHQLVSDNEIEEWRSTPQRACPEDRLYYMMNTALAGLVFIFMHEVGHVVNAHIAFLERLLSTTFNTLFEHDNKPTVNAVNRQLRNLETNADIHASLTVIDFAMTAWAAGKVFPVSFQPPKGTVFSYVISIYRGILLAIFSIDWNSLNRRLDNRGTHPAPGVRAGIVLLVTEKILKYAFNVPYQLCTAAFTAAFAEIGDMFLRHNWPALTLQNDIAVLLDKARVLASKQPELDEGLRHLVDQRLRRLGYDPSLFDKVSVLRDSRLPIAIRDY